ERTEGDVLVYSGYPIEALHDHLRRVDGLIDALISDPFEQQVPQTRALRGSDNQRLHLLTDKGRARFAEFERELSPSDRALDLMFDDNGVIWLAGIPRRDDMNRLQDLLKAQGHHVITTADRSRQS